MKKISITLLFLFTIGMVHAQERESGSLSSEDLRKIVNHLQSRYRVPKEALLDSIHRLDYQIQFQIDEEGYIQEPKVIRKTSECKPCERELLRVMKNVPKVNPAVQNGRKVKVLYTLPFNIQLQ